MNTEETLGKMNYHYYSESVGGKSWSGEPLKKFEEMPLYIRSAWTHSANKIAEFVKTEIKFNEVELIETINKIESELIKDNVIVVIDLDMPIVEPEPEPEIISVTEINIEIPINEIVVIEPEPEPEQKEVKVEYVPVLVPIITNHAKASEENQKVDNSCCCTIS